MVLSLFISHFCGLPSIVSLLVVYAFFFYFMFLFARSWHFYTARFIAAPTLFSPAMPPILFLHQTPDLCIGSRSTVLSASMHALLNVTIKQMLLYLSPITYGPPPKMLTFHFSPSIVTRLESIHRENQRLCSMSVMASWFFGIAPSFAGEPRIQQQPLSFRNLKGDRHIWGISLKSKNKPSVALSNP